MSGLPRVITEQDEIRVCGVLKSLGMDSYCRLCSPRRDAGGAANTASPARTAADSGRSYYSVDYETDPQKRKDMDW